MGGERKDSFMSRSMGVWGMSLVAVIAYLAGCQGLRAATAAPPTPAASPMLGTAWYPEQWPESRWETDLSLMDKAGIRMVRVGEFAWSRMEPSDGQYDLDWLERAVNAAGK